MCAGRRRSDSYRIALTCALGVSARVVPDGASECRRNLRELCRWVPKWVFLPMQAGDGSVTLVTVSYNAQVTVVSRRSTFDIAPCVPN
jgi:hypothetical protein